MSVRALGHAVLLGSVGAVLQSCDDGSAARAPCARAGVPVHVGPETVDADQDGLDDTIEDAWARNHLPFLAQHPRDACPRSALVFRVRPHPNDAALVAITYSWLYDVDCGLNAHLGDNEGFGVTIDPAVPAPSGVVAMVAIGHQGTPCERTTSCGWCGDLTPCDTVDGRPILYASKDKHAGSVSTAFGCGAGSCLDQCEVPLASAAPPMINVGEPDAPLVNDLTLAGLVTIEAGWNSELLHKDPWSKQDFGDAGNIAGDLVDDAFVAPTCQCPSE